MSAAGTKIERLGLGAAAEMLESANVRIGQIGHVNVIANGSAVGRRILVAEYADFFMRIGGRGENVGDQVGFRIMIFAAAFRGAGGVEIAEAHGFQAVGCVIGFKKALESKLRPAIGIFWPLRRVFPNRHFLGFAVDRRGGGEHKTADAGAQQSAQERNSLAHIVLEIFSGIFFGFADADERSEMDTGFDGVFFDNPRDEGAITGGALIERDGGVKGFAVAVGKIVENDDAFIFTC